MFIREIKAPRASARVRLWLRICLAKGSRIARNIFSSNASTAVGVLKAYPRRSLLIAVFAVFFVLLSFYLFHLTYGTNEKLLSQSLISPKCQVLGKVSLGLPVRLTIPAINVNANILHLGVTQTGEMEAPGDAVEVGWFKLGPRPGETGSAVIAGHFDGRNGEAGVFTNLYKLIKGDKLYIEDEKGISITFTVRESRTYNTGYVEEVFNSSDSAHLNLITCDGVWDGTKKSYSKRLVVFSDKE